ncbi:ribosyldihydronicotinamide dehydrogenase [quinone] isoform X2 [Bombina bombina]|nr:ribosyldihydronicotinamide dehydrogenase [quinone] isoform X2 [Bombina bombina]
MNGSLKDAAVDVFHKRGYRVIVSDLYAMEFNAVATKNDVLGDLCNPEHFNYATETTEAFKSGLLCEEITKEQKKIQDADLIIFQFPLYWFSFPAIMKGWIDRVFIKGFAFNVPSHRCDGLLQGKKALLSFTTGGTKEMYSKEGAKGDIQLVIWPIHHGILHFCGIKVLVPHIAYAPELVTEEKRKEIITLWAQRLENIWDEKPIDCTSSCLFK